MGTTAISPTAVGRGVGILEQFQNLQGGIFLLPQRVAILGQGSSASTYDLVKTTFTSAVAVGTKYGFGSPVHLSALQLLPANGDGIGDIPLTVYPLEDAGTGVVSTGDITPTIAATVAAAYKVVVNDIESESFVVSVGDSVATVVTAMTAAINAIVDMPIIAADGTTKVDVTSKWQGTSANQITLSVTGDLTLGNTYAFTQPVGGLVNPEAAEIAAALDQFGDIWETLVVNCFEVEDETILDQLQTWGEGRWGAIVKKPLQFFTGTNIASQASAIVISDTRKDDRINGQLVAPGSPDLDFVIAARELARIAKQANEKPPYDYGSLLATGLTPGTDAEQWNWTERDAAVKAGSSTIQVKDGIVALSDTVTFYHPTGETVPAYRYTVDLVKIWNILFNLDLIFNTPEWDGAPLVPDDEPGVTDPGVKRPKTAVAAVASMIDSLAAKAIVVDAKSAKASIVASINDSNPKRLDITFTAKLSGNVNIISIDFNWGFLFGTA